jgi:ABC-2 type transport system permease protein
MPLLPMSIGSAIGFVVAKVSSKMKSKNIIMIIGSFALLILIMGVSFSIQNIVNEQAITDMVSSISNIDSSFFLFSLYVDAVYDLNLISLLLLILIFVVPFFYLFICSGNPLKK